MFTRFILVLAILATLATGLATSASASPSQPISIATSKPPGPVPGTFAASGAFADSGTINNLSFAPSAFGSPTFGVSHITILFAGSAGTFTLKAQITETLTSDPNVLTDNGTWTIIDGTGAYANLRGQGTVVGTVDDNVNLITRTYQGNVHFN